MSLDSIVNVSITTLTTAISRAGFGTPMLAAYFPTSIFSTRTRLYTSLSTMASDGFPITHPAYLMATALKAQQTSVPSWYVGRKANPPVQTIDITPTITTVGETLRLTVEGTEVTYTILSGDTVETICDALTPLLDAIVGVTCTDNTTHMTLTPNRVNSVTLTVDTPDNEEDFTVTINGTAYTFTSDTAATVTEIRDGLEALITAGGLVTATDNSTDAIDLAAIDEAGFEALETAGGSGAMSFSASVSNYDLLSVASPSAGITIKDNTPDPGIAADLTAIIGENSSWYGLLIDSESEAQILAAAAWAEAQTVLFLASIYDTQAKDAADTTDTGSDLKTAGYARTGTIFSESSQQYGGARWIGKMFPKDPGEATWAYQKLAGFNTTVLTGGEVAALDGKNINHYQNINGAPVTQKGYSASGEYLDITRGVDWFKARLQERFYSLLVNNEKLPFTDATADLVRAEILAQLSEGQGQGVIAPNTDDTPWVVDVPTVGEVSAADKANRLFPDIEFSAYLAGAVHTLQISGTLSV